MRLLGQELATAAQQVHIQSKLQLLVLPCVVLAVTMEASAVDGCAEQESGRGGVHRQAGHLQGVTGGAVQAGRAITRHMTGNAGDRELAQELAYKCKEHDQLAADARCRANAVAFDGFNRSLLNRWKVRRGRRPPASTTASTELDGAHALAPWL